MLDFTMVVQGVYIGFDFGTKKIGIAVGQTVTQTTNPLTTLSAINGIPDWQQLANILEEWQPKGLIVGMPLQPDGSHSKTSRQALQFINALKKRFKIPIFTIEERLTSVAAHEEIKSRKPHEQTKQSKDAVAASIILRSWFNQITQENSPHGR